MLLVIAVSSLAVVGACLFVAFGGLRPSTLRLPLSLLLADSATHVSSELQRRASRTFSFTSFGIQKKNKGTGPQGSRYWGYIGWPAWGIRQYPKTTPLGSKCEAPLTVGSRVYLTSLQDEWEIAEIFCLPKFPTLPQAVLLQSTQTRSEFILTFSGFKFPICWPFPGVRTGLPLSLLRLAWDNFCEVRKAESCSLLPGEEEAGVKVNRLALRYLRALDGFVDAENENVKLGAEKSNVHGGGGGSRSGGDRDHVLLTSTIVKVLSQHAHPKILVTGHSNGGSMAQVFSLMLARENVPNLALSCIAHGAMRTGNSAFYSRIQQLGIKLSCFTYAVPCYEDATEVQVDEIPFAPVCGSNFQDPPEVYLMLTLKKRPLPGQSSKHLPPPTRVLRRLNPQGQPLNAPDTALTAKIPSFPKNHIAGLYEDYFVKMHELARVSERM